MERMNTILGISIPAPARGRTRCCLRLSVWPLFQFPPPRGGELASARRWGKLSNFNSRPREGANTSYIIISVSIGDFNSRPREGANGITAPAP